MSEMFTLPKVEAILERQARMWEVRRRLAEEGGEAARNALAHLSEGPWVTVSKQVGSGETDFTRRLGDALGWQVFDREILKTISEHTHTRETVLSRLDEHAIKPVIDLITAWFDPNHPGGVPFHQEVIRVVVGLAKKGNAVIVGRGANWFLDGRFGLRIRVVASMDERADRLAKRETLDAAAARRKAQGADADQEAFIRQVFGKDIDDPTGYDLVLNLSSLGVGTATDLAVTALRRKLGLGA